MKNPPAPPDGKRALSAYRLPDEHRRMRIVAWLVASPIFVALFPWFGIVLPGLLAIVLYVVLLEWGREDKHDPLVLFATAFVVYGGAFAALLDHVVAAAGAMFSPQGDPWEHHQYFLPLGVGFVLAVASLVSLHLRPRRRGLVLALCCLVQAPVWASWQYCWIYGPTQVDDYFGAPRVELVTSSHSWTPAWERRAGVWELRVLKEEMWHVRYPSRHVANGHRPPWAYFPSASQLGSLPPLYREEELPTERRRSAPSPRASYPLALLIEAEVPWRLVEKSLRDLCLGEGAYEEWAFSWDLQVVIGDGGSPARRSLPLQLVPRRDVENEALDLQAARLTIVRRGSAREAAAEYAFEGRVEPDPAPIARMVADHWDDGGVLVLDVDPELPWRVFVDLLDRTWTDSPAADRTCRVAFAPR